MGMQLKVGGRLITSKFAPALEDMTKNTLSSLQQQITVTGNAEGERFARDLLERAKQKAPVGSYKGMQNLDLDRKSSFTYGQRKMAGAVGANLIEYHKGNSVSLRIQMRNEKGRFTKQREVQQFAGKKGLTHAGVAHSPGALRDSGRVETRGAGNKKRFVVSFDTRRTDPYSMMHNFNYAIVQHNDVTFRHKHGESGFLVKALLELKQEYFVRLSSAIGRDIRKHGWGRGK